MNYLLEEILENSGIITEGKNIGTLYHFTCKNFSSKNVRIDLIDILKNGLTKNKSNSNFENNKAFCFSRDATLKWDGVVRIALDGNKLTNSYKLVPFSHEGSYHLNRERAMKKWKKEYKSLKEDSKFVRNESEERIPFNNVKGEHLKIIKFIKFIDIETRFISHEELKKFAEIKKELELNFKIKIRLVKLFTNEISQNKYLIN